MAHLIFLPGFYGTRLVDKATGKIVWISAGQAIFGSRTAARSDFGVSGALDLVPGSVLDRLPVIPGLYALDVYRHFLDELHALLGPQTQCHLLGYDWRADYIEAVKKLAGLVRTLKAQDAAPILLVAHSLGGIVASYYLRYGEQEPETARESWQGAGHLDAVVLATVPFQGSMTAFRNMKHGVKFGLNTSLINPRAFSTFTTGYTMLPTYRPVLLDHRLRALSHTLFEPELWRRYAWGLLGPTEAVSAALAEKRWTSVSQSLFRGRLLYDRLHQPLERRPERPTPVLYAWAGSHPTLSRAVVLERPAAEVIFERREFAARLPGQPYRALCDDGDRTVTTESARPPPAFRQALRVEECQSQAVHSQIFNDRRVRDRIRTFLRAKR